MASSNRWLSLAKALLGPVIDTLTKGNRSSGGGQQRGTGTRSSGTTSARPGSGARSGSGSRQQSGPKPSRPNSRPGGSPGASAGGSRSSSSREVSADEAAQRGANYAGDYRGRLNPVYAPAPDGDPDPGEVVWAWVPYEEDHSQGKDRPVLIVGRNGSLLLALMLTSKDHTREHDRDYIDVGTGAWDRQGRPSEAKLDRVLQLDESAVRREGAVLDAGVFENVASALRSR